MKRNGLWFAALLMALTALAACGSNSGGGSAASQSQPQPAPLSSEAVSASFHVDATTSPTPRADAALQSGKVLALGDPSLTRFPADTALGTQAELDRWKEAFASGAIVSIAVNNMGETESDLSLDQARSIVKALAEAELRLYDQLGNPPTGGGISVVAYDVSGDILFHGVYNGEWFSVAFGEEQIAYILNGEDSSLDHLAELVPS